MLKEDIKDTSEQNLPLEHNFSLAETLPLAERLSLKKDSLLR